MVPTSRQFALSWSLQRLAPDDWDDLVRDVTLIRPATGRAHLHLLESLAHWPGWRRIDNNGVRVNVGGYSVVSEIHRTRAGPRLRLACPSTRDLMT